MSLKQPTFKQRTRLLDICAHEISAHAEKLIGNPAQQKKLHQVAELIAEEAARMKLANQRWEQSRQHKTASKETALTS